VGKFAAAAKLRPSYFNFVVAIEGDPQEGQSATFAGETVIYTLYQAQE
jgi:hypothetical protein